MHFRISHIHNFEMNDNDIADQFQLQYPLMRFCCNIKWQWALWFWGFEVSLVNTFMLYCWYHKELHIRPNTTTKKKLRCVSRHTLIQWIIGQHATILWIFSPKEERQQCIHLTSNSICHVYGMLKCHCDIILSHFPQPSQKEKNPIQCQLHMWTFKSAKKGKRAKIIPNQRVHAHKLSNVLHAKLIVVLTVLIFLSSWQFEKFN